MTGQAVRDALVALAARLACCAPTSVVVTPTPSQALIAVAGDVVVKAHRQGTDARALSARLAIAADPLSGECLVQPLIRRPLVLEKGAEDANPAGKAQRGCLGGRWASAWPRVETVAPVPGCVPWAAAGAVLARLHSRPIVGWLPQHGAVARVERAVERLARTLTAWPEHTAARRAVLDAAAALPPAAWQARADGRPRTVVHGDWHLGQLGRLKGPLSGPSSGPSSGPLSGTVSGPSSGRSSSREGRDARDSADWLLIDPDDLGLGDPVWDFARPAALLAAGVLAPDDWRVLVDAYRAGGGAALPGPPHMPWSDPLDVVARAGVVQGAAAALGRAVAADRALDDGELGLVEACRALAPPS